MSEIYGSMFGWFLKLIEGILMFSLAVLVLGLGSYVITVNEIDRQLADGVSFSELHYSDNYDVTQVSSDDQIIKYNIETTIAQYGFRDIDIDKTISVRKNQ